MGMGVLSQGLGYLHKGEEVLEAGEVSRIEAALAGQSLNQMAMDRFGMQTGGMRGSSAPIVIDNSSIQNNNTSTTITNPIGQMLPGESDDFVRKVA